MKQLLKPDCDRSLLDMYEKYNGICADDNNGNLSFIRLLNSSGADD